MAYGQYSATSPGKLTLAAQTPTGAQEVRRAGHNRLTYARDGVRYFRLIHTDVVSFDPATGRIEINTGGWSTPTTRKAIADGFRALGLTATRHDGYLDGQGQPQRFPPHPLPADWRWRPVKTSGRLPDDWFVQVYGASKRKGEGANGLYVGPSGAWSADPRGVRARFRQRLTLRLVEGGVEVVESDLAD